MEGFNFAQHERMRLEHEAWLDVGEEFRARGLDMEGRDNGLHNAIVKWGEELAQLRIHDPDTAHAEKALAERRVLYPGRAA